MRAIVLLAGILIALGIALPNPFAGILLWTWFSLQSPHQEAWGFVNSAPLNLIIALVTIAVWLLSRERKLPPYSLIFTLLIIFMAWTTFNSFFAYDPGWSWPYWERTIKIFILGILVAVMANSRARLYALIWIAVISLFYFGVRGGLFTIVTGGRYHVFGPNGTIINDNNQLALALLMALPLAEFLRRQVANKSISFLLLIGSLLTVTSVIASYSRGAFIGLGALAGVMFFRAQKRLRYLGLALLVGFALVQFMPANFFDRMDTIGAAQDDASFQGRVSAWRVAYMYASDHFPFGAGFYGTQLATVFHHYFPGESLHAAHSIYFQVLGENGFIGLAIYLGIILAAFVTCQRIIRASAKLPDLQWASDLAIALQTSLFVFCVAGAGLSMAYYDLFVIEVAALLPLHEVVFATVRKQSRLPNSNSRISRYIPIRDAPPGAAPENLPTI